MVGETAYHRCTHLSAVVLLDGVWMWNDFLLVFTLVTEEARTSLPVGVMAFRGT